jgi:hypothetical protein
MYQELVAHLQHYKGISRSDDGGSISYTSAKIYLILHPYQT